MNDRKLYMDQLLEYKDKNIIKIVTGIRNCGKTTLLDSLVKYLLKSGTLEENIIYINFDNIKSYGFRDSRRLYEYIDGKIQNDNKTYVILDELQLVKEWEGIIKKLIDKYDLDIYISSSCADILSTKLNKLFLGRYIEIKMLPLSFKEFIDLTLSNQLISIEDKFDQYLIHGGLPSIIELNNNDSIIRNYLLGIYNMVIMKDVIHKNVIKDIPLLENVVKFIFINIGNKISPNKISEYINDGNKKTRGETVDNYLEMLENSFMLFKIRRYDFKSMQYLKTLNKYYAVDLGIRNVLLDYEDANYGHFIENIVYLELLRRKFDISMGKFNNYEIDFIATKDNIVIYYQVTLSLNNKLNRLRKIASLEALPDSHEKIILTMDKNIEQTHSSIKFINIIDFLLDEKY